MPTSQEESLFQEWTEREALAEQMLPLLGKLYRENGVITQIYGRNLVNRSVTDILKTHRFARQILKREIYVRETYPLVKAMAGMDLAPARIDLGKLCHRYQQLPQPPAVATFLQEQLASVNTGKGQVLSQPRDVVLYGFGRIGRLLACILIDQVGGGDKLRLRAAVVRKGDKEDLVKRASLLRRDSVHGPFRGVIQIDEDNNAIIANGISIRLIYADAPEQVNYQEYGIDNAILIDNTGKWRDREGLERHLQAPGVSQVVLTAPGKGNVPNIVHGVNNDSLSPAQEQIYSAASCTTNAIVPVLKAVQDKFGIEHGHMETCHAYTNDQNLIDNYHKKNRRGRGAPLNMVLTETGAASAVAKAIPELEGKLTGNAIRVPTPNVSMAILNLTLQESTSKEDLNTYLLEMSLESHLQDQIDYTASPEVVSSDFVGNRFAGIVDGLATIVEGNRCVLYVWYDNEFGYSCQVVGMVEELAGMARPLLPQ